VRISQGSHRSRLQRRYCSGRSSTATALPRRRRHRAPLPAGRRRGRSQTTPSRFSARGRLPAPHPPPSRRQPLRRSGPPRLPPPLLPRGRRERYRHSPCADAAASDSGPQQENLSVPDSSVPNAKRARRRMTKLAVAVAAGSVLAALLVYAMIAMKRLDAAEIGPAAREAEAFEQNMDVVGRLRHPNLVPLRAFFQAKEERLLVYDGRRMSFCCSYDSCSRGVVRVSYSRGAGAPGAGSPRATVTSPTCSATTSPATAPSRARPTTPPPPRPPHPARLAPFSSRGIGRPSFITSTTDSKRCPDRI
jgi:hypothetical protein